MCFIVIYWTRFSENSSSLRPFVDCYHDLNLWIERNAKTKLRTWDEKFVTFRNNIGEIQFAVHSPIESLAFVRLRNQVLFVHQSGLLIDVAWYTFRFIWVVLNFNFLTFLFIDYSNLVDSPLIKAYITHGWRKFMLDEMVSRPAW